MVELKPLASLNREQFIKDNQEAFNYGALQEFGKRDDYFEEDGQVVGGVVIKVDGNQGDLELRNIHFYVNRCDSHIV